MQLAIRDVTRTPEHVATELGLKFSVEPMPGGKAKRFRFEFPDYDKVEVEKNTVAFRGVPKDFEAPKDFLATVKSVTKWRERIKPWLFVGTTDTVASELTLGQRISVGMWNRKNRKKLKAAAKAAEKSEAYGRQLAMSQPTPMQGVKILDELTKLAEPETQELRKSLIEASQKAEQMLAAAKAHADETCGCPGTPCVVVMSQLAREAELAKNADVVDLAEMRARRAV